MPETEEGARSFVRFFEDLANGQAQMDASEALHELVNELHDEALRTANGVTGDFTLKLKIPNGCVVGMPVFRGGDVFQVPVRIRHRIKEGTVTWSVDFHRLDLVFQTAFNEAVDEVREATALPVFYGRPEVD